MKDELKRLALLHIFLFFGKVDLKEKALLNDIKILRKKLDKKFGKINVDEFLFEILELQC